MTEHEPVAKYGFTRPFSDEEVLLNDPLIKSIKAYEKKPVTVEAVRWDGTAGAARSIIRWVSYHGGMATFYAPGPVGANRTPSLGIDTLEGTMLARSGDFVIRGVAGEFYPCRSDIFAHTYEELDGQQ